MMQETNDDSQTEIKEETLAITDQLKEAATETEVPSSSLPSQRLPVTSSLPPPVAPPAFNVNPLSPLQPSAGNIPEVYSSSAHVYTPPVPPQAPVSQGVYRDTVASVDIGLDSDIQPLNNSGPLSPSSPGLIGWFTGSKIVNKMKTGVETMITTLDPGMKEYIRSGGDVDIVITSEQEAKLSAVREAFQTVFGKATVRPEASEVMAAPQPVGYTAGVKGAEERIQNLRRTGRISPQQPAISVENFMAELLPDKWFDVGCLLLVDPRHQIELQVFTQAVPIPSEIVSQIQDETPSDYDLRWSGYAVTLGEVIQKKMPFVDRKAWHLAYTGVSRREMILIAAKSLAGLYQQRLPSSEDI